MLKIPYFILMFWGLIFFKVDNPMVTDSFFFFCFFLHFKYVIPFSYALCCFWWEFSNNSSICFPSFNLSVSSGCFQDLFLHLLFLAIWQQCVELRFSFIYLTVPYLDPWFFGMVFLSNVKHFGPYILKYIFCIILSLLTF